MARQPITRAHPYTPSRGAFAGRTFTTERAYRDALAQRKGYRSFAEEQRAPRVIRSERGLSRLSQREQDERERALRAVRLMRRNGKPLSTAARDARTTPNLVRKYVGDTVEKRGGRYVARPRDTLARSMVMFTVEEAEPVPLIVTSSDIATTIARHANAVRKYLNAYTEDLRARARAELQQFDGTYVQVGAHRYHFLTDTTDIDFRARYGLLSYEGLYVLVA